MFSLKIQRSHGLKIRFCETLNQMISHGSDGYLLTPHNGVFEEISPIVVSFSIKHTEQKLYQFGHYES